MPDCFLDTNVLLYAALGSEDAPEKWAAARNLVETRDYSTSAQVLAEFYTNATNAKKWKVPLQAEDAAKWVAVISAKPCVDLDSAVVMRGIELSLRYKTSYWDGAILSAAEKMNVRTVFTEDLNDGQTYGSVTVVNPFQSNPSFQ